MIMVIFAIVKAMPFRHSNTITTPTTMTPTIDFIRSQFVAFNARYFGGSLPEPRFVITHARTILGQFVCRRRRGWGLIAGKPCDCAIKVSGYFDMPEKEYQNVLLHEMIHYYIAYHRINDTSPHGEKFREIMARLNQEGGWNIGIRGHAKQYGLANKSVAQRPRVVVAMTTNDGKHFLSVVQRSAVSNIEAMICQISAIASHEWFVTTDSYFSNFPQVRTLRAKRMAESMFKSVVEKLREENNKSS